MKYYKLTINEVDGIKYRFESTDLGEIMRKVKQHDASDIEVDIEDIGIFKGREIKNHKQQQR